MRMDIKKLVQFIGSVDAEDASLSEHDKRFHPEGYKEGDACKLREKMSKQDKADSKLAENTAAAPSKQDYDDLMEIRDRLEPIARLLNGRKGNLSALQSSSRWQALNDYPSKSYTADDRRLKALGASQDSDVRKSAASLAQVAGAIVASSANNWSDGTPLVPAKSDLPKYGNGQPAAPAANGNPNFTDNDAKALLLDAAKSINHHIDKGDNTPNQKKIAALKAAKADIAALNDKTLDNLYAEFEASEKAGFTKRMGKVPSPSSGSPTSANGLTPSAIKSILASMGASTPTPAPVVASPSAGSQSGAWTPFQKKSGWESQLNQINSNHPAATDPNWFKNQADAMSKAQAISQMEANGDIVKGGYRDSIDKNDPDERELWAGWSPSKKLSDDTAKCCAVTFADLRGRFPNMPWKSNLELRCGTKPLTGGQSTHTSDWRRHTVLFNCDYGNIWGGTGLGKSNYGHPDARFPYDVLRHEMGHALISGVLPNGKRMITTWHDAMTKAYGFPSTDLEKYARKYVSAYAVTKKGNGFSMAECLSECFSLATSPDYKPGYLPPPVEDFIFGEMLGMKKNAQ